MTKKTAFYWDENCMWHGGGYFSGLIPTGGFVQPSFVSSLPEAPETKRRFKNLLEVSGLMSELCLRAAPLPSMDTLALVHPMSYLEEFERLSAGDGGDLGRAMGDYSPFGPGGYEMCARSAGLAMQVVEDVASGRVSNGYALCRPPGHHCLPAAPNGYCLLANGALAVKSAMEKGLAARVAILDWDVHHGNGTEAIFWDQPEVLTISVHQERNYPLNTGNFVAADYSAHSNLNIPLPPGAGHATYLQSMDELILPALRAFEPDFLLVSCGFDASAVDVLSRTLCSAETFRAMTQRVMDFTSGRVAMIHEGGYSELHVPFCGHAVMETLSGSNIHVPDPLHDRIMAQQVSAPIANAMGALISEMATALVL